MIATESKSLKAWGEGRRIGRHLSKSSRIRREANDTCRIGFVTRLVNAKSADEHEMLELTAGDDGSLGGGGARADIEK